MRILRRRRLIWLGIVVLLTGILYLRFSDRRITKPSVNLLPRDEALPLKIVTFNAHLLPPIAGRLIGKRSNPNYRAREIANQLQHFDIIGVCEAFSEMPASLMIDEFNRQGTPNFSHIRSPPPAKLSQFTSGGLILFSRLPILDSNTLSFTGGTRFVSNRFQAADGLAAKGVVHARVQPGQDPGRAIDCYLTHLESHSRSVRREQVFELTSFIRSTHDRRNAILIMGDLNIVGPKSNIENNNPTSDKFGEYKFLLEELSNPNSGLIDTGLADAATAKGTSDAVAVAGGQRIDYIFFGHSNASNDRLTFDSATLPLLDSQVPEGSLSDHAAVWCTIDRSH